MNAKRDGRAATCHHWECKACLARIYTWLGTSQGKPCTPFVIYLMAVSPILATVCVLVLSFPANAGTFDFMEDVAAPFQDPLQTAPEVVEKGVTLPGDAAPVPCPVSKDFAKPLALIEAVDIALCNNAQIKAAWANIKVQAAAVGQARAAYLPTTSGTVSYLNDHTSYPGTNVNATSNNRHTVYGSLVWRLFDFGGREANREAANWSLTAALASHDAVLQNTLAGVIQAYFDAQTGKAAWQSKQQIEELAKSTLDTAKRREDKGEAGRSDTLQATTALARAALDKNRAMGDYRKAISVLVYAMGVPTHTALTLADDVEDVSGQAIKDLDEWLETAQQQHPAILATRAQLEAAKNKVMATRSAGLPTLDFAGYYYQNGRPGQGLTLTQTQERTLGVMLTVPLFDGFSTTYKIRGAEAQVEQSEAQLLDTEHQILMEVVKAHADASASLLNLQASETLLAAAQDALGVSKRKFEKDAADILEILNTQSALADAQQERIRSLAEWRSARLRLLANAGLMGRNAVEP